MYSLWTIVLTFSFCVVIEPGLVSKIRGSNWQRWWVFSVFHLFISLSDQLDLALIRPDWCLSSGSYDRFVEGFHVFEQFWFSSEASTPTPTIPTSFEWWFLRLMLFTSVHRKPTKRGLALFVTTFNVNSKCHFRFQMDLGPLDSENRDSTIRLIFWTGQKETPLHLRGGVFDWLRIWNSFRSLWIR